MKKDNRFLQWLKRPHGVFLWLIFLCVVVFSVLSVVVAVKGTERYGVAAYLLFAAAAIFLGYGVYAAVIYVPHAKIAFKKCLGRYKFTAKIMDNYGFKTAVFSLCSFAFTVAFATMNLVSAIRYRLVWYAAIAAYYFILLVFRGGIIFADRKYRKELGENTEKYGRVKWKIYLAGGAVLVVLEFAMAVAVTQTVLSRRPMHKGEIMTIANAAYTFYKMTMAVYNLLKARKFRDPVVQALRNINFADACMSIVSLTVLMLSTFGDPDGMMFIKAGTGFAACATIIAMASVMIVSAYKKLTERKGEEL